MSSPSAADSCRQIGWNDLRFSLPAAWEVIVAGPRHLLVEDRLQPMVEIRWERDGAASTESVYLGAVRQLAGSGRTVARRVPPEPYRTTLAHLDVTGLSWQHERQLDGLVWQCRQCGTIIFCSLGDASREAGSAVARLLASLDCRHEPGEPALWSVQDFRLLLPPGYSYVDSTFAAGLSRLAFSGHNLQLQFCRLAPASARLGVGSLACHLRTMLGSPETEEILTETEQAHEQRNRPSAGRRLMARLARKPVFRWGRIWHDSAHDRLLSLVAASSRPIDLETVRHLCRYYEILPLPHSSTSTAQPD